MRKEKLRKSKIESEQLDVEMTGFVWSDGWIWVILNHVLFWLDSVPSCLLDD